MQPLDAEPTGAVVAKPSSALIVRFTVQGEAVPKGRHKTGRNKKTGAPVHYTPAATVAFEKLVGMKGKIAHGSQAPVKGAFLISIVAISTAPRSWTQSKRDRATTNEIPKITKPDGTNVAKAVEDALNSIVYCDDSAATLSMVFKRYGRTARTIVSIYDATKENSMAECFEHVQGAWRRPL